MQVEMLSPLRASPGRAARDKRPLELDDAHPGLSPKRSPAPSPPPDPSGPRIGDEAGRYAAPDSPSYHRADCVRVHAAPSGASALQIIASPFRSDLLRLPSWREAEAAGLVPCASCRASPALAHRAAAWEAANESLYEPSRDEAEERARRDAALRYALLAEGGDEGSDPFSGELF
eukprot:tig00000057_g26.t1